MIEVRSGTKTCRRRNKPPLRALDGLDLTVEARGAHGFLGPNGSGKTTIRALLGLVRTDSAARVRWRTPVRVVMCLPSGLGVDVRPFHGVRGDRPRVVVLHWRRRLLPGDRTAVSSPTRRRMWRE